MSPGQLSEVELLKVFGDSQWCRIAECLERPAGRIVNAFGERLYASFVSIELSLGSRGLMGLGEDTRISTMHRVQFYADQFVEGLVVFDGEEIAESELDGVSTRGDLDGLQRPWAYMTNAFVTRTASNTRLTVFSPDGIADQKGPKAAAKPLGIAEHALVQSSGEIAPLEPGPAIKIPVETRGRVSYKIVPESDINGAGLLYFARYVAIMNYGVRVFLSRNISNPLSSRLISFLTTDRRKVFYFANAEPSDTVEIGLSARLVTPDLFGTPAHGPELTTPFKLNFRLDLFRASDGVLMASSDVLASLTIPGKVKSVTTEAQRFLAAARTWS